LQFSAKPFAPRCSASHTACFVWPSLDLSKLASTGHRSPRPAHTDLLSLIERDCIIPRPGTIYTLVRRVYLTDITPDFDFMQIFLPLLIQDDPFSFFFCRLAVWPVVSLRLRSRSFLHSFDLHPAPSNSISHTGSGRSDLFLNISLYHLWSSILQSLTLFFAPQPCCSVASRSTCVSWTWSIDIPLVKMQHPH